MGRQRGERNWEEVYGDYELHLPSPGTFKHMKDDVRRINNIVMICGYEFILAADGKLEPVERD